jgi:uncharacterized membrane protein
VLGCAAIPHDRPPEADEGPEGAISTEPGLPGLLPQAAGQVSAAAEAGDAAEVGDIGEAADLGAAVDVAEAPEAGAAADAGQVNGAMDAGQVNGAAQVGEVSAVADAGQVNGAADAQVKGAAEVGEPPVARRPLVTRRALAARQAADGLPAPEASPPAEVSPAAGSRWAAGVREAAEAGQAAQARQAAADRAAAEAERAQAEKAAQALAARRPDWVPWLIALVVFGAYSVISISRYLRLDPGSWDLGIFTEDIKQFAHLHAPIVNIRGAGFNLLGDHFQPIVALVSPFFRLAPSPVTLLVAQALLTALSVIPVSRAATAKLGVSAGRVIGVAYGFSWGLQQMIDFDFHEIAFAVPLLACSLSALLRGKTRAAALWALPLVFVKEDQGFTVAAIGVIIMIDARRARLRAEAEASAPADAEASAPAEASLPAEAEAGAPAEATASADASPSTIRDADIGLFLMFWGIAWSLAAILIIIPHFNPAHQYLYWQAGGAVGGPGHHSLGALLSQTVQGYHEKLDTTALILLPVAFLALRSPLALIALPSLALRFISTNNSYWGTAWHYNATVMPIVFIAAIDALAQIQAGRTAGGRARGKARRVTATAIVRFSPAVMLAVAVLLAFRFPLDGLWNPGTYTINQHVRAENAAMAKVPDGATVETTLTMLAPLAARTDTYWIGTFPNPPPQYIVFDDSDSGWNPNPQNALAFVEARHPGTTYRQIFLANEVYVFRRS